MKEARTILVHKATLGVLRRIWAGASYVTFDGATVPRMVPVTLETYGLDRAEWWEVPDGTPLARRIALNYPFFDPVVAGGELVGAEVWPVWKRYGEGPPEDAPPPRRRGKYNRRKKQMYEEETV